MAADRDTPARSRFLTALHRRSWTAGSFATATRTRSGNASTATTATRTRSPAPRPAPRATRARAVGGPSRRACERNAGDWGNAREPAIVEARMPPRSRTLGDLLDETARARPDADAVIFRDQRLTYGALRARADELARALLAVGVRKGDRVAVLLPNRPEWLVAAFAIGKLGAITVGVSTFSAPREIADRKSTRLNSSHGYISYAVF